MGSWEAGGLQSQLAVLKSQSSLCDWTFLSLSFPLCRVGIDTVPPSYIWLL